MKNVTNVALVCSACLLVVGIGLLTANPAISQGNRPSTEIRVVNDADQSAPRQVTSLPASQAGIGTKAPVRVNQLERFNQLESASGQASRTPITMSGVLSIAGGARLGEADLGRIPGDKVLVAESFNWETFSPDHTQRSMVTVQTVHIGLPRFQRFVTDLSLDVDGSGRTQVGAHNVQIFGDPGTMVRIRVARSKATIATSLHVTLTGYLISRS